MAIPQELIEAQCDRVGRSPAWLSLLLLLVMFSPVVASAEEADLGDAYDNGFRAYESSDYAAALVLWIPLAEQGDPRAQFGLGLIYEAGLGGTPKDEEAALGWYRRAARLGLSPAQNNLALMYAEGRVIPRDLELAVALWRQAATAGYGPAQLNLAHALETGSGVERDEREAAEWQERANAQRLATAKTGSLEPGREDSPIDGGAGADEPRQAPVPVAVVRSEPRSLPPKISTPDAPAPADACYVQLASLRNRDDAIRFGNEVSRLQPELLAEWQPTVRTVDLGAKGEWHRVLFGPIQGRKQAAALCAQIQARVGPCLVAPAP